MKKNPRIEITITKADKDIEQFLNATDTPNATLFKMAMRSYMQQQENEQLDLRIKRLLEEVLAKHTLASPLTSSPLASPAIPKIKDSDTEKKRLGFTAKKI